MNFIVYLIIVFTISICISVHTLWKYANRKVFSTYMYFLIFLQFFCSISLVLIIPLDLSLSLYARKSIDEQNNYNNSYNIIFNTYKCLYWTTTLLGNIVLVFSEEYILNGFFTVWTKIRNTCKKLSIRTVIVCVVCGMFIMILTFAKTIKLNFNVLFLTSMLITNTTWMTFLMLLMGYGLISYPIDIWKRSNYETRLSLIQKEISLEFELVAKAYANIYMIALNIQETKKKILSMKEYDKNIMYAIETLLLNIPIDLNFTGGNMNGKIICNTETGKITIGALAYYSEQLYLANLIFTTSQGTLNKLQSKAYYLEDIVNNIKSITNIKNEFDDNKTLIWSFKPSSSYVEYIWYIHIKPVCYKLFAVLCGILSMCSYLGIMSLIYDVPKNISVYFLIIHNNKISQIAIAIFSFVTIGYLWLVIRWALFETKIFRSVKLVGNKVSWPTTMSINSRIFGSLILPLIFFYLGWVHENGISNNNTNNNTNNTSEKINTVFSEFYKMKLIPIAGNSLNMFFPILIISFSLLTILKQLNNFLEKIKCGNLKFGINYSDIKNLDEAKNILTHRKKLLKNAYINMLNFQNKSIENTSQNELINFLKSFQQSKLHFSDTFIDNPIETTNLSDLLESSNPLDIQEQHIDNNFLSVKIGEKEYFSKYGILSDK